jgi:hypothetical protein
VTRGVIYEADPRTGAREARDPQGAEAQRDQRGVPRASRQAARLLQPDERAARPATAHAEHHQVAPLARPRGRSRTTNS